MAGGTFLNEEARECVLELVQINIDSAAGFDAAEKVDAEGDLGLLFRDLLGQRTRFGGELSELVGGAPEVATGTLLGTAHHWWTNLRATMSSDETFAVLDEAVRGEDRLQKAYERAIEATLGTPACEVLRRHYAQVVEGHDRLRAARDRTRAMRNRADS